MRVHDPPRRLLGKEGLGLGAGMIPCSILNQEDGLCRLLQHTPEKSNVRGGIETPVLPLIKELPGEVLNQPEDFIAFALA